MKNCFYPGRLLAFAVALATMSAAGGAAWAADIAGGAECLPFIHQAEDYYHMPQGLLEAIALTESGQAGKPYPWSLNVAGRPVFAPSYQAATRWLRSPDGRPRRDVAIGCMQIHMRFHLTSFGNPEWALLPRYNVWYAAQYLQSLHNTYGDWETAVAHYNASDPVAQRQYLCRVAGHLPDSGPRRAIAGCSARPSAPAKRRAIMTARRVGRLIVIGER